MNEAYLIHSTDYSGEPIAANDPCVLELEERLKRLCDTPSQTELDALTQRLSRLLDGKPSTAEAAARVAAMIARAEYEEHRLMQLLAAMPEVASSDSYASVETVTVMETGVTEQSDLPVAPPPLPKRAPPTVPSKPVHLHGVAPVANISAQTAPPVLGDAPQTQLPPRRELLKAKYADQLAQKHVQAQVQNPSEECTVM
eukprot:TRINITY_DN633_c0_g1_i2.p2 TRINITY_DN633_c0_g1~~TRINITY_DN633_c0_g1_i2.p2  ORF type:complete len:199 (-),score=49.47 TRINITY_DN633_c0_g1_i2:1188-1784(-)